ncbi:MAG: NUDIX domain-containing protein [Chloroflexi bacterium]|nr:NUDIX domain-containing protein [Chloroflexota bacterium]
MERTDAPEPLVRHFTATGFLAHDGYTALHWHRLGKWLPPGGHLDPNEDPLQAALREIREETGVAARVIETATPYVRGDRARVQPPVSIGIYRVPADSHAPAAHEHIDFIYFVRPAEPGPRPPLPAGDPPWLWVSEAELRAQAPLASGDREAPLPDDVRALGLAAIEWERHDRARSGTSAPEAAAMGAA